MSPGGLVRLRGDRFSRGMRAAFRVRGGARHTFPTGVKSRTLARVTVPKDAVAGPLYVRDRGGRRSNAVRPMRIAAPTLDPAPKPTPASALARPPAARSTAAACGSGTCRKSERRRPDAIVAQARGARRRTVFVKSADGANAGRSSRRSSSPR